LPENSTLSYSDDKETSPPLKKTKLSIPDSTPQENSIQQSCSPLFQELANSSLLQKSKNYSMMLSFSKNKLIFISKIIKEDSKNTHWYCFLYGF